ncbi:uncharacterized protein KY384_000184 [Bacidia gigantensis]|uniref:uncharacterized protein n=1 Tax=Bacidia gigantensis TaxID=2732470 RepID=UPI001D05276F|nr:uncharacterized protein KY384_000184 [Bacidia gigantensis]KAG8526191.1 hypothetical protein KY384_000184 [Bacidia gigantensis]
MPARRPAPGLNVQAKNDDNPSASKKPRFDVRNPSALAPDAVEEDAMLEADEIGKRGQQVKRNAVNIDGYESDSSNEGFDARADAKAKELKAQGKSNGRGSKQEVENDMFAGIEEAEPGEGVDGDDDEELAAEGKRRKKEVKFLDEKEIEGQVLNSKSGGHVSADFSVNGNGIANGGGKGKGREQEEESSSDESEVDEEDRAALGEADEEIGAGGKKEHAPKVDAFNMRNENEEGRFDASGNFVRKAADPDAVHDSWLVGVSKKDMKRAKEASDQRNEQLRAKQMEDDKMLTGDVLKSLISNLQIGETVLEALARLGTGKKEKPKWQRNRRKNGDEMDVDKEKPPEDPKETRRKEAVEAITEAADLLLTRGKTEIYDTERELLTRQYTRETGEQWVDSRQDDDDDTNEIDESRHWQYRWSDGRDRVEAHGPYDSKMMKAWIDAGYFGDGVEYREVGTSDWLKVLDL